MPASLSTVKPTCIGSKMCDFSLSASLRSWLGHELEVRGIDAVIYTRYILSILQQDSFDLEHTDSTYFPLQRKDDATSLFWKGKGKKKSSTSKTPSETLKKNAAVECLLSVTDEDSGIESLVDELYCRIQQQIEVTNLGPAMPENSNLDLHESDSVISTSPEDPAERYYAAFPALSDDPPAQLVQVTVEKPMVWSQVAQKSFLQDVIIAEADSGSDEPNLLEQVDINADSEYNVSSSCNNGDKFLQQQREQKSGFISETRSWPNLQALAPPEFIVPKLQPTSSSSRSPRPKTRPFTIQSMPEPVPKLLEDMFHEASQSMLASHLTEELTVVEESEDFGWYTEPVDHMVAQSSWSSQRLYQRQQSSRNSNLDQMELSFDYLFENDKGEESPQLQQEPEKTPKRSIDFGLAGLIDQMKDWAVREDVNGIQIYTTDEKDPDNFQFSQIWNTGMDKQDLCDAKSQSEEEDDVFLPPNAYTCNLNTGKSNQQESLFSPLPAGCVWDAPSSTVGHGELNDGPHLGLDVASSTINSFSDWTVNSEFQDHEIHNTPPGSTCDTITPNGSLVDSCGSTLGSYKLSNSSEATASLWSQIITEQQETEQLSCVSEYANETCDKSSNNYKLSEAEYDQHSGKPGIWAFSENTSKTDECDWPELYDKGDVDQSDTISESWPTEDLKNTEKTENESICVATADHQESILATLEEPLFRTLQLWDVNIQSKREKDNITRERAGTMESIKKYLINLNMGNSKEVDVQSLDFIEGGLYGSGLPTNQNIWKGSVDLSDKDFGVEEETQLWKDFSLQPDISKLRSTSLSQIENVPSCQFTSRVEIAPHCSKDIQPSENTAFRDQIPHRISGMSHSFSSPSFTFTVTCPENPCKMVQVKHLYNFNGEDGLLEQLGLASRGEVRNDELEYSPERHFRPIRTPCDKTPSSTNTKSDGKCGSKQQSKDDVDKDFEDIGHCVGYQSFQRRSAEENSSEIEHVNKKGAFVPKFKVEKEREKYIQTGKSLDETGEDELFTIFSVTEEDEDEYLAVEQEATDRKLKSLTEHTITQMLNAKKKKVPTATLR